MNDQTSTIEQLKQMTKKFCDDRDWQPLNTPKNLSMSIAAEAAELMEFFMWVDNKGSFEELEKHREEIEHEVADILMGLLAFSYEHSIDLAKVYERKLKLTGLKYPIKQKDA